MRSPRILILTAALAASLVGLSHAGAQTTNPGGQGLDLNAILQTLGLGGLLQGQTPTTPTTPTTPGTGTPTTQPSGPAEQAPSIVENQFTTTGSAALQARAPGLYTQHARAVQEGSVTLTGDFVDQPGFGMNLATDISNTVLNTWSGIFTAVDTFLKAMSGIGSIDLGGGGTTSLPTIPNSATEGQGDTTTIERTSGT